ncbi:ferredoxin family protein [Enterobacteriaceae bacterium RIT691]|nr:ferredoxin family protein [Enterobacteriaceae bacterium RIT691]
MSVNESLLRNCYHPANASHIELHAQLTDEQYALLEKICPAGVFQRQANGQISVHFQGCLECGCCRRVAGDEAITTWRFPPSGAGIHLRYG